LVNQFNFGELLTRVLLKVGRKGVVIIPKKLREVLGIKEGDELIAEASEGALVMRPFKPKIVEIDPKLVEEMLSEEGGLEREKVESLVRKVLPRH